MNTKGWPFKLQPQITLVVPPPPGPASDLLCEAPFPDFGMRSRVGQTVLVTQR